MLPETKEAAAATDTFEQNPVAFADPLLFGIPPPTAGVEIGPPEDVWN